MAISEIRTMASTVDVRRLNHHAASVGGRCILDFIIPTTKSRAVTTSIHRGRGGQDTHVSQIVTQLPTKTNCRGALSILWVLAVSNPHDINYEGWPILLPWRFPGRQVPNLTTHTSDSPFSS